MEETDSTFSESLVTKLMRVLGFEPKTYGLKGRCSKNISAANKELTKSDNPDLSTSLDSLCAKDDDFRRLAEAWPKLPEHIKQAIKAMVEAV